MRYLIYDGDCPFCARYVDYLNLKKRFPDIELLSAREHPDHDAVRIVRVSGMLIDDGMAIVDDEEIVHGAEAISMLSGGMTHGVFFSSQERAKRSYGLLRKGRSAVLKLLGRQKLGF